MAPYGLVQVYQRLWRTCLHHQAVHSFERRYASNQTTQCHLSEEGSALLRLDTVYEFALYEKKRRTDTATVMSTNFMFKILTLEFQ